MACLALSLQPANGSDVLLQTREWFPPARALAALSSFRQKRIAFAPGKQNAAFASEDADASLGDDPLAASSGQLLVGVDRQYRIVYRLVNAIYVLGIATIHHNVFDCITTVNQAVSVLVAACRGVDVTPEKLHRKYAEVYMALDVVLRGVSSIRLATILSCIHGDGISKMLHSAVDAENRVRGADTWYNVEAATVTHQANVELYSNALFELPPETLAAGDEVAATLVPGAAPDQPDQQTQKTDEPTEEKDPFAASDALNKPEELVGGFKKNKESGSNSDITSALSGLEVTTLPPAAATQSTFIGVEGFEGDYGGIEYSKEASLSEAFEGFDDAFGGGLDASEFVGPTKAVKPLLGLGGLEELQSGQSAKTEATTAGAGAPLENLLASKKAEMKGPELYFSEEISAEFCESLLARVGLQGVLYLKTMPPPKDSTAKETEFSFHIDGRAGIKRCVMQSSDVSSLGNGIFHVRAPHRKEPMPLLKYSLQPCFTPIPLRVRLITRCSGTLLAVMIQYASNPGLLAPLSDVKFVLKLPVDPTLLNVSPKALLNRSKKELCWHVEEIPLKGPPGSLRAQMPVDFDDPNFDKEFGVVCRVNFLGQGASTLSGVFVRPVSDDKTDFYQVNHKYMSGTYMCC
ncbi:hypothetical protein H6P81_012330 [Aristolochia fimbriata]|uniref:MHD domain-containing protein n=1 Tax=Aristolochia fimbriata TaxID=158543 RepID=A0AAV7EF68_ARIFI|nr:hypothetical protein H6P81_012330 [Aristolochia fimbriata]